MGKAGVGASISMAMLAAACSQPEPPADAGPISALAAAPEFATCEWGEATGAGLAIGAFTCGPDLSSTRLVADEALPGFRLTMDGPDGPVSSVAVRVFAKAPGAPVESVLASVRAASPGAFTARCALVLAPAQEGQPNDRYSLTPTGEDDVKWEASVVSDTPMEAPCGPLGVSIVGDRYFRALPDDPSKVVFVELGSEIQTYDPATLRAATP